MSVGLSRNKTSWSARAHGGMGDAAPSSLILYPSNSSLLVEGARLKAAICVVPTAALVRVVSIAERRPRVGGTGGPQGTVAAASACWYSSRRKLSERSRYPGINNIDWIPDEGFGDNIHDPTERSGS